jgi:acetoin utilization deacetylase AcuC-like enzyme
VQYHVYYSPDFVASEYAFDTTRKSGELAALIERTDSAAILTDPTPFIERTESLISAAHEVEYVEAVKTGNPRPLAESQGFGWDQNLPTMAVAHSAGLVAAVTEVLTGSARVAGSLSSGLHHARRNRGNGFCTFNGLAVAASSAIDLGVERILVLDLDAHCGGGTRSMTDRETVVQVDVSTIAFDRWSPNSFDQLLFADADNYLPRVGEALELADKAGTFDLVLYNAGMDPSDSGVSPSALQQREQMVAQWAGERNHRLVYALAGGYTGRGIGMSELVDLHNLTVEAFG